MAKPYNHDELIIQYDKLTPEHKGKVTRFIYNLLTVQRAELRIYHQAEWIKRTEWTVEQRENDPSVHGEQVHCSFCGKPLDQAERMIAGDKSYICDECVKICTEIIADPDAYKKRVDSEEQQTPRS